MWWAQPKLHLVAHRAVYDKQRRRFCRAIQGGDRKEIRQLEKLNRAISWRCAYAAWEGDELTEHVLFVMLGNHFPGHAEELIEFLHSKAQITRERCLPA